MKDPDYGGGGDGDRPRELSIPDVPRAELHSLGAKCPACLSSKGSSNLCR